MTVTCETLHLNPEAREEARRRLLSVKGHVEGVLRMLEDESVYCVEVLKQLKAVASSPFWPGNPFTLYG